MSADTTTQTTQTGTISPAELRRSLADGDRAPLLLDVRTDGEFEAGHIPGSVLLPLHRVQEDPAKVASELAPCGEVVVVCRSGKRASTAAEELAPHLGAATPLRVLTGGMTAWEQAGGDSAEGDGTGVWDMQRQVRFVAGTLVLGAIALSAKVPAAKWMAAGVGTGLAVSGATGACPMAGALALMPWNRGSSLEDDLCAVRERHAGR